VLAVNTCGELADYLATQPRDRKIVLQKDAEGNGYSPLADADEAMYAADNTWSGDVYMTPEELAEQKDPDDYSEAPEDAERVVVLGPVN
jgi:hypothetical protein